MKERFNICLFQLSSWHLPISIYNVCSLLNFTVLFLKSISYYEQARFNWNTVKVSYSCMRNVAQIIKKHNQQISSHKEKPIPSCNCRNKDECPMNGKCQVQNVVYKCTVSATPNFPKRVYLGVAEGDWKLRFYNHK